MRLGSLAVAHSRLRERARSVARLAAASAAMLLAFASLRAQETAARGTLDGIVTDTSEFSHTGGGGALYLWTREK